MLKFLLIVAIVFLALIVGVGIILKKFLNSFISVSGKKSGSTSYGPFKESASVKNKKDVIYEKDDIVVLKGEAGKKRKDSD